MKTKYLGKKNSYNKKSHSLLDPIERLTSSAKFGVDIWNIYDFMYLDKNNIPKLDIIEIKIPSKSKKIIESKSMKLYFNSFYNKKFSSKTEIISSIKNDFSKIITSNISVRFIKNFPKSPSSIDISKIKSKKTKPNKILSFNGFRSICPVTSQPDFAFIYIFSDVSIDVHWLKKYLISYKDHGDFHEQCIDKIFNDIQDKFLPNHLEVCGRFHRRGGIDINPIRGSKRKKLFVNFRILNQ